jgi:hypothetical protein
VITPRHQPGAVALVKASAVSATAANTAEGSREQEGRQVRDRVFPDAVHLGKI